MPWVRLDDQFSDHPKILRAGPLAGWLFVCGLTYCARQLSDGFIPRSMVRRLADLDNAGELAQRLVDAGLWEACGDGFRVHDYLEYNPSAAQVRHEREGNRERQRAFRDRHRLQVYERDRGRCRYCGAPVPIDRFFVDHVIPARCGGTHDPTNLVTCCPACNTRKRNRTPEEAGTTVLPVATTKEVTPLRGRDESNAVTEGERNASVTRSHPIPSPPLPTDPRQNQTPSGEAPPPPPTGAGAPGPGKPGKLGEFIALVRAAGQDYETVPGDPKAVKESRLSAAQIAEVYVALAAGECGDPWMRDRLSARIAISAWNGYQASKRAPPKGRQNGRTSVADIAAQRLRALRAGGEEHGAHERRPAAGLRVLPGGHGPADGELPPPRGIG
jgi:5-methylcytosine-specific restriction endonuclease McrA